MRRLQLSTLLVILALCALPARAQDCARALQLMVRPDDAAMKIVQEALDHGLPSGAAGVTLHGVVERNTPALDALQAASASPLVVTAGELPALRTLIAITLTRGQETLAARDATAAARDALTVWRVGRQLINSPEVTQRVIGAACVSRACALGLQLPADAAAPLRAAISSAPLPSLDAIAQAEKTRYLAEAARAARLDGQLAPHVTQAAEGLATTYYGALLHPAESTVADFEALFARLGNTYGMLDPQKVLSLLPSPPPPPAKLGQDIAGIVLCMTWLDSRLLVRRYAEALQKAQQLSR